MMLLSVVVPAYNESKMLENSIRALKRHLNKIKGGYEILIAEDGSTDGTDKMVKEIAKRSKYVRSIHSRKKLGRGLALKRAFATCRGDVLGYIDADLAPNPKHIKEMLGYAKDFDIVIASRYLKGAKMKRPLLRDIASRSYNWLLRNLFSCDIHDFQCGLKIFSRRFVKKIVYGVKENSWAWDTVMLVEAVKRGYIVKEIPIEWSEKKEASHSASFHRLKSDFFIHGKVILKLFAKWKLGIKLGV